MQPTIAAERPPYVTFEYQAVEDRAASIEAGHYVTRNVAFAIITPAGSKDRIYRQAEEWFASKQRDVEEERFPAEWLRQYAAAFDAWKKGEELPEHGTPVANWPAASPAQVRALLNANIRTVEDLAAANEEALMRIGMGSRALKDLATSWLSSAQDTGKVAAENAALKLEVEELRTALKELAARLPATPVQSTPLPAATPARAAR